MATLLVELRLALDHHFHYFFCLYVERMGIWSHWQRVNGVERMNGFSAGASGTGLE